MTLRLENRWSEFLHELGASKAGASFAAIVVHYSQPLRAYHNLNHIAHCLEEFDHARHLAHQPVAVEAAIWFHDAIYDSRAKDNENRSAELATGFLRSVNADEALVNSVSKLILATKSHDPSAGADAPLVVDVDLSILGQTEDRFDEFERQIREEYAWVPEDKFAEGRVAVLTSFLRRARIYSTEFFRAAYEIQARDNLNRSLRKLGKHTRKSIRA